MNKIKPALLNSDVLLYAAVAVILYFGLRPYADENKVQVANDNTAIVFAESSQLYTDYWPATDNNSADTFSIALEITPVFFKTPRFSIIMQLFDVKSNREITIGQWKRSIMVLTSNDYSNKKKLPKIYAMLPNDETTFHILIESSASGTQVTINGTHAGFNQQLFLQHPNNPQRTRLVLGSSISGNAPWSGRLHHLTINEVEYAFANAQLEQITDTSGYGLSLVYSDKVKVLKNSAFQLPELTTRYFKRMAVDIVLNFFGFIPFGYLLAIKVSTKNNAAATLVYVAALSFAFTLALELVQIWIPGRHSSLLDLTLNATGGLTGGILYQIQRAYSRSR